MVTHVINRMIQRRLNQIKIILKNRYKFLHMNPSSTCSSKYHKTMFTDIYIIVVEIIIISYRMMDLFPLF